MFGLKKKVKEQIVIHAFLEFPGESLCDMKEPPKHQLNEFNLASHTCKISMTVRIGTVCPSCLSILINTLPEDEKDEMIDRMAQLQKKERQC